MHARAHLLRARERERETLLPAGSGSSWRTQIGAFCSTYKVSAFFSWKLQPRLSTYYLSACLPSEDDYFGSTYDKSFSSSSFSPTTPFPATHTHAQQSDRIVAFSPYKLGEKATSWPHCHSGCIPMKGSDTLSSAAPPVLFQNK